MKLLTVSFLTPEENLAFEEYFFDHFEEDTLRLWINPASVVVGKHQNAMAEANVRFCVENNIPVIRRISGGGTVYHDLGNINFSFFRRMPEDKLIDYHRNLDIVHALLNQLGFPVHISPRHDLFLNDFKISGNAQHVKRGKSLHHGTILYDANLGALSAGIKRTSGDFIDKGVKSVRSQITNLRAFHDLGDTNNFYNKLTDGFLNLGFETLELNTDSVQQALESYLPKYHQESWNYGYSPNYMFSNSFSGYHSEMSVARGGKIEHISVSNANGNWIELENILIGKNHFYKELIKELQVNFSEEELAIIESLIF